MLCIAVIGAGHIGKIHAATVAAHPQAWLMLAYDLLIEAAEALAEFLGARTSADATETFSTNDVDAVIIGSPVPLHTEHILATARAGKAVSCERPAAFLAEATHVLADELAISEHSSTMVSFQRCYDPSIARAQWLVVEGRIGHIEQFTTASRDPAPPSVKYLTQSGGMFKGMTIHDLGEARFFLDEIVSVSAIGQKFDPALVDVGDSDSVVMTLRAVSGAVAAIRNTRHCVSSYDQKVEVFRSENGVVAEDLCVTPAQANDAMGSVQQEVYLDFFLEHYAGAYHDELTTFTDAVSDDSPVTPTVEDGVAVLVLAEVAERSARGGQTVEVTK